MPNPVFSASALRGLFSLGRQRHLAALPLQPGGGDYSQGPDSDVDLNTGVTKAYAVAVTLVDPATGAPYAAASGGGGATTVSPVAAYTERNGTITTGGTSKAFLVAGTAYRYARLTNPRDAVESLWFREDGAGAGVNDGVSEELAPGEVMTWTIPPSGGITITAATTGHAYRGVSAQ